MSLSLLSPLRRGAPPSAGLSRPAKRRLRAAPSTVAGCLLLGVALIVATALGCRRLPRHADASILARPVMPADTFVLELYTVRLSPHAGEYLQMWTHVDEHRIATPLRQRLYRNGLRAGIVTGPLPPELERLLQLSDEPAAEAGEQQVVAVDEPAQVRMRRLQVASGKPAKIQTAPLAETLHVLLADEKGVRGGTYSQAQPAWDVRGYAEANGAVRLNLAPEIEHGEVQRQWDASDGMMFLKPGRPKKAFDQLRIGVDLLPGQLLVVGCIAGREGSLGDKLLATNAAEADQHTLLAIRLAQAPEAALFAEASEGDETADVAVAGQ